MKALIIIIALVGLSFLGLLVYGASRDPQPKSKCARIAAFQSKNDVGEDDLEGWCPPALAMATRPLQARFAPDLGIEPAILQAAAIGTAAFPVLSSDKKMRAARIELIAGDYAILEGTGGNKLCLCPAGPMNDKLDSDSCPDRWRKDHVSPQKGPALVCTADDVRGILPFEKEGGSVVLLGGPKAKVRIE